MNRQFYSPPLTKTNRNLLIVLGIFFIAEKIIGASMGFSLQSVLGLSYRGVLSGGFFQFFTYPIVQHGFLSAIFNGLIIWFLGGELESLWGPRKYLLYMFVSSLIGGVIYFIASAIFPKFGNFPFVGITGIIMSLCMAYGLRFQERMMSFMFFFPMKAKYFCMMIVGLEVLFAFAPGYGLAPVGHLGAMLAGFLFLRLPAGGLGNFLKREKKSVQERNKKRNFYIVKDENDENDQPKYWQ